MKEPKERKGGRPLGPPSTRMSLYLENEIVDWIRNRATKRRAKFKDIVSEVLKPIVTNNGGQYLKRSAVEKALAGKHLITEEQYAHTETMAYNNFRLLILMHTLPLPFILNSPEWQQACAEREHDLAESFRLFLGYSDAAEAREVVRQLLREELEKHDREAERLVKEQAPLPSPQRRGVLGALNLFRRRR